MAFGEDITNSVDFKDIIYNEWCLGNINDASRHEDLCIINELVVEGAQAIIVGCTEIVLLIKPEDTLIRLFDTTALHCDAAVKQALDAL
ncbi:hypothetical protein V6259_15970 [Marinomonas sp. TI.3.20]|uniref:hypothetical protein n=1 Tax=Marinomonas sp. TI.3.20 TaxID=3121296 RepID=UPI00311E493F